MIRILFLAFLVFVHFNMQGQIKSGKIVYSLEKNSKNILNDKELNTTNFQKDLLRIGQSLQFELAFNEYESVFKLSESMSIDKNEFKTHMAIFILRGNSVFSTMRKEKKLIEYREYVGEQLIITNPLSKYKWELLNDSKHIKGYNCYKAVGTKYGKDKNGDITKNPIIVWYTPEVPFPYGPYESGGLPGLVLEYELGKFKWITHKITLDEKKRLINVDTKGRNITEEELEKKISKKMY